MAAQKENDSREQDIKDLQTRSRAHLKVVEEAFMTEVVNEELAMGFEPAGHFSQQCLHITIHDVADDLFAPGRICLGILCAHWGR